MKEAKQTMGKATLIVCAPESTAQKKEWDARFYERVIKPKMMKRGRRK